MTTEHYAELMLSFPLFQGFTAHGAGFILEKGAIKEHASGEVIFHEGDPPGSVMLALSGTAEIYVERNGKVIPLTESGPGTILGELAVLCGIPRAASLRAKGTLVALHWTNQNFRQLMVSNVALSERILRNSLRTLIDKERSLINSLNPAS